MRDNGVPPSRVKTLEQLLRKAVLDATPIIQNGPAGKGQMRQQEPKAVLLRELQKADPVPRTGKISIDKFNKVLERRFHFNLTVSEAQAIFAKYGFVKESEKWRMPYAMFCARLFSARGHIVSMAGALSCWLAACELSQSCVVGLRSDGLFCSLDFLQARATARCGWTSPSR